MIRFGKAQGGAHRFVKILARHDAVPDPVDGHAPAPGGVIGPPGKARLIRAVQLIRGRNAVRALVDGKAEIGGVFRGGDAALDARAAGPGQERFFGIVPGVIPPAAGPVLCSRCDRQKARAEIGGIAPFHRAGVHVDISIVDAVPAVHQVERVPLGRRVGVGQAVPGIFLPVRDLVRVQAQGGHADLPGRGRGVVVEQRLPNGKIGVPHGEAAIGGVRGGGHGLFRIAAVGEAGEEIHIGVIPGGGPGEGAAVAAPRRDGQKAGGKIHAVLGVHEAAGGSADIAFFDAALDDEVIGGKKAQGRIQHVVGQPGFHGGPGLRRG